MLKTLIDGLGFAEGLRWHNGRLWFSDFLTRKVQAVDIDGNSEIMGFVPGQPSGLGFLPDGSALVVSMLDRRLLRLEPEQLYPVADLGNLTPHPCNDMLVDARGNAFIGAFNYNMWYESVSPTATSALLRISPQGEASIAADKLRMPNGIVMLPDGKTLVVAETQAQRLSAFDVAVDGTLSGRRIFADLGETSPDGLCVDDEGQVWVAGLYSGVFLRVKDGGEITQRIEVPGQWAVACALGGCQGNTLFCATTTLERPSDLRMGRATSSIQYCTVNVPYTR